MKFQDQCVRVLNMFEVMKMTILMSFTILVVTAASMDGYGDGRLSTTDTAYGDHSNDESSEPDSSGVRASNDIGEDGIETETTDPSDASSTTEFPFEPQPLELPDKAIFRFPLHCPPNYYADYRIRRCVPIFQ